MFGDLGKKIGEDVAGSIDDLLNRGDDLIQGAFKGLQELLGNGEPEPVPVRVPVKDKGNRPQVDDSDPFSSFDFHGPRS